MISAEGSLGSCLKGGQSIKYHSSFSHRFTLLKDLVLLRILASFIIFIIPAVRRGLLRSNAVTVTTWVRDLILRTWLNRTTIMGTAVVTDKIPSILIARSPTIIVNTTFVVLNTRLKPGRTWLVGGTAVGVATTSNCYGTASAIPGVGPIAVSALDPSMSRRLLLMEIVGGHLKMIVAVKGEAVTIFLC